MNTIESFIGNTPLVPLQRIPARDAIDASNTIFSKLEGNNPAGSVKDRPAMSMINGAEVRGEIRQIRIRDVTSFPLDYWGLSGVFTFKPSSTIAFNSIVNAGGTALSTWTAGSYSDLYSDVTRIAILPVPEPSSFALIGLGISTLLLGKQRKLLR